MEKNTIELKPLEVKFMEVTIVGDGDLILNKMNDVTTRTLIDQRKNKAKDMGEINVWEQIITSMHWHKGKPNDFSEQGLRDALKDNAPCITAYGLKESFGEAVVRLEYDRYRTKWDASVNVIGTLFPISFSEHYIDEKLFSPRKGRPVLSYLNRFTGWKCTFTISYIDNVFSAEQIVNIISSAGFSMGIGSGRKSGKGRYHIESVKAI